MYGGRRIMGSAKKNASASLQRRVGFLIALCFSPIVFIFAYFGHIEKGFVVSCLCGVFAIAVYMKRDLVRGPYAISAIAILFVLELVAIMIVGIPERHFPGIVIMPLAVLNYIIVLLTLRLILRITGSG
jgi:hypothetical protein